MIRAGFSLFGQVSLLAACLSGCSTRADPAATGGAATGGASSGGGTGGTVSSEGGAGGTGDGENCKAPHTLEEFNDPTLCETLGYEIVLRVPTGVDCAGRAFTTQLGSHFFEVSFFDDQGRLTSRLVSSAYDGFSDRCTTGLPEPADWKACSAERCLVCHGVRSPPWDDPPEEPPCEP